MTSSPLAATSPRKGIPLWLVVVLCLLGFLLMVAAFIGVVLHEVQHSLRESRPYHMALTQISAAPCVTQRLGAPLVPGSFIVGSISHDGNQTSGNGYADLHIPVHGPSAAGRIHVIAREDNGQWVLEYLALNTGSDRLLLLPAAAPCQ